MKTQEETKDHLNQILKTVMDPEVELNIVDLGLIYNLDFDGENRVNIIMTLSTPACPLGDAIVLNVKESIKNEYPDFDVNVDLVFEPLWTAALISDEGKAKLGM
ncbi:MAG: metal-sulfur cluster assembly factor [Ignavibacteriae bacterium]|nr:metal-sulfur cluster assembly factor [Ignavibacteriota bacterium]